MRASVSVNFSYVLRFLRNLADMWAWWPAIIHPIFVKFGRRMTKKSAKTDTRSTSCTSGVRGTRRSVPLTKVMNILKNNLKSGIISNVKSNKNSICFVYLGMGSYYKKHELIGATQYVYRVTGGLLPWLVDPGW